MSPSGLLFMSIAMQLVPIFASYCGEDAIPFSLQALSSGQPVLGCARPSCFGWGDKTGQKKPARFYRIHKKNDGFMRKNDLKKYDKLKITARESQLAFCEKSSTSLACDENTQWVGGISPSSNATAQAFFLQCCTFANLKDSWDRGVADVAPGQIVVGGEVMHGERQYAFDYIANVKKYFKDGSPTYSVTVRRFRCVPYLERPSVRVDESAKSFIISKIVTNRNNNAPKETAVEHQESQVNGETVLSPPLTNQSSSQKPAGAMNQKLRISQSPDGDVVLPPTVVGSTASGITNLANGSAQSASPDATALSPLVPFLPSLSILPLNGATSAVALDATNHQPNVLNFGTGQQQAAIANLPGRAFIDGQQTLQTSQQTFPLQPQSQLALQMVPNLGQVQPLQPLQPPQQLLQPPQQPLQLSQQSLVSQQLPPSGQQIQQMQPQLSQFPTFPSLNQLGIPLLPSLPSSPTIFG